MSQYESRPLESFEASNRIATGPGCRATHVHGFKTGEVVLGWIEGALTLTKRLSADEASDLGHELLHAAAMARDARAA